jgi:hypothetical protein
VHGHRHAPAALPLGKTRYALYGRLRGPRGQSGHVRKTLPPPDRPARSQSLYRLSYPAYVFKSNQCLFSALSRKQKYSEEYALLINITEGAHLVFTVLFTELTLVSTVTHKQSLLTAVLSVLCTNAVSQTDLANT